MMETIEKKKNQRIQTADAWRKYKRVSYQRQFEGLEYQANIDFVVSDAYLGMACTRHHGSHSSFCFSVERMVYGGASWIR